MSKASSPKPFLTADWRYLAMLNYAVDPALIEPLLPPGTAIDFFDGRAYVSLVAFLFQDTRVRGVPVPFHRDFEEVNLRYYVRRVEGPDVRRGVAFYKEIVPRFAIAFLARALFHENYVSLPMSHRLVRSGGTDREGLGVEYRWRHNGRSHCVSVQAGGLPETPAPGSLEQFISEHYWGYSKPPDGRLIEYRVEHPPWRVWPAREAKFEGDAGPLYGAEMARILCRPPDSAFLAEGSAVTVYDGVRK